MTTEAEVIPMASGALRRRRPFQSCHAFHMKALEWIAAQGGHPFYASELADYLSTVWSAMQRRQTRQARIGKAISLLRRLEGEGLVIHREVPHPQNRALPRLEWEANFTNLLEVTS